ncbi:hypothetical protein OC846_005671 [Tilletia horrida]|uniref:Myb-like domain-containing protein n=1 Tax=Tilletia horrida TaxID=155126 RepID=A0AAN6GMX1_9BASI|nr:hypothetical protein OC846_005671 [Tilletia horrida]KAK0568703.1 hypothetical protein OC861_001705 [Tilletia horrida]
MTADTASSVGGLTEDKEVTSSTLAGGDNIAAEPAIPSNKNGNDDYTRSRTPSPILPRLQKLPEFSGSADSTGHLSFPPFGISQAHLDSILHDSTTDAPDPSLMQLPDIESLVLTVQALAGDLANTEDTKTQQLMHSAKTLGEQALGYAQNNAVLRSSLNNTRVHALSAINALSASASHTTVAERDLRQRLQVELEGQRAQSRMLAGMMGRAKAKTQAENPTHVLKKEDETQVGYGSGSDAGADTMTHGELLKDRSRIIADRRFLKNRVKDAEAQLMRMESELKALRPLMISASAGPSSPHYRALPWPSTLRNQHPYSYGQQHGYLSDPFALGSATSVYPPNSSGIGSGPTSPSKRDRLLSQQQHQHHTQQSRRRRAATLGDAESEHLILAARRYREYTRRAERDGAILEDSTTRAQDSDGGADGSRNAATFPVSERARAQTQQGGQAAGYPQGSDRHYANSSQFSHQQQHQPGYAFPPGEGGQATSPILAGARTALAGQVPGHVPFVPYGLHYNYLSDPRDAAVSAAVMNGYAHGSNLPMTLSNGPPGTPQHPSPNPFEPGTAVHTQFPSAVAAAQQQSQGSANSYSGYVSRAHPNPVSADRSSAASGAGSKSSGMPGNNSGVLSSIVSGGNTPRTPPPMHDRLPRGARTDGSISRIRSIPNSPRGSPSAVMRGAEWPARSGHHPNAHHLHHPATIGAGPAPTPPHPSATPVIGINASPSGSGLFSDLLNAAQSALRPGQEGRALVQSRIHGRRPDGRTIGGLERRPLGPGEGPFERDEDDNDSLPYSDDDSEDSSGRGGKRPQQSAWTSYEQGIDEESSNNARSGNSAKNGLGSPKRRRVSAQLNSPSKRAAKGSRKTGTIPNDSAPGSPSKDRTPRAAFGSNSAGAGGHASTAGSKRGSASLHQKGNSGSNAGLSALDLLADQAAASSNQSQNSGDSGSEQQSLGPASRLSIGGGRRSSADGEDDGMDVETFSTGHSDGKQGGFDRLTASQLAGEKRSTYTRWSSEEDTKLRAAILQHGQRWELVSRAVETRSYHQCRQRYLLLRRKEAAAKSDANAAGSQDGSGGRYDAQNSQRTPRASSVASSTTSNGRAHSQRTNSIPSDGGDMDQTMTSHRERAAIGALYHHPEEGRHEGGDDRGAQPDGDRRMELRSVSREADEGATAHVADQAPAKGEVREIDEVSEEP